MLPTSEYCKLTSFPEKATKANIKFPDVLTGNKAYYAVAD